LLELRGRLLRWLREEALPVWEAHGIDRRSGGYFETLIVGSDGRGYLGQGAVRRGRVVARQMFVFDAGRRLGWEAAQPDPVRHGCEFLFSRLKRSDGLFHVAIDLESSQPHPAFDLYEHAFYLFSLARVHAELSAHFPTLETATSCLRLMRQGWGKANGGFEESSPSSLPLKSNPHMHLLEAALAWIESTAPASAEQAPWVALATELCDLCLEHFVDPRSGAVREYFDGQWLPIKDDRGRIVEPGHQFEWAWLLMRWAAAPQCLDAQRRACSAAAPRLVQLAERYGVDPRRGVAFNELWDDMTPKDAAAKLWPQTERVKAWCSMMRAAGSPAQSLAAGEHLGLAMTGLLRYLEGAAAGLWHEVLLPDGTFTREPCKASSFYHIVCAIETVQQSLSEMAAAV
jgi:mannose-6-phosphate isomerase